MLVPAIALEAFVHDDIKAAPGQLLYASAHVAAELERKNLIRVRRMLRSRRVADAPPRRWEGQTLVIMASGPSLTKDDVAVVERWRSAGGGRSMVVNTTFRVALWADALFSCDARWWTVYGHEVERDFKGELWAGDQRLAEWINVVQVVDDLGLSTNPKRIHSGLNSGYQAMGLAFHWGVARIVLLGYDMQRTFGKDHHHGKHAGGLPNLGTLPQWIERMDRLAAELREQGVEVINASRHTALKCFARLPIEEALGIA